MCYAAPTYRSLLTTVFPHPFLLPHHGASPPHCPSYRLCDAITESQVGV